MRSFFSWLYDILWRPAPPKPAPPLSAPRPRMVFIVAGNIEQARAHAFARGLKPGSWMYVTGVNALYGRDVDEYLLVGTWAERRDIVEILRMLDQRKAITVARGD
jgi:hypothetical protein